MLKNIDLFFGVAYLLTRISDICVNEYEKNINYFYKLFAY